ncbi:DUF429 domain-containing protein [Neobacillus cucumis]|uniref:DUF429 domain-containing protein n=1 Tax=Neobacillus cucumis TaxID=1740721 RepID=UPI001963A5B2|nr:DUF429 domain-containing protein [Neobacillus cucumis]MBM7650904.1 putative nuclease with RNAse H fold [Neobacillus cucumis]
MRIMGIDLSGPNNHRDTVLTVFEKQENQLKFVKWKNNISDQDILNEVTEQAHLGEVVVGMDAPLSYEDGGGDRQGDRELRKFIVGLGMKPGSIMPPTLNKMVYLTLRGIKLTREIENLNVPYPVSIVEVHPGAVIGSRLSKSDFANVLTYKQDLSVRRFIWNWLGHQNLMELPDMCEEPSHWIDACAAALGAWHWKGPHYKPNWVFPAKPPLHPYDYCC